MRIYLLGILLLALPWIASGEPKTFALNEIVKVVVTLEDPKDIHLKNNTVTFGTFNESFRFDAAQKTLKLVTRIPSYNRQASPPLVVEVKDQAHNVARVTAGAKEFPRPKIEEMKVDEKAPSIREVQQAREKNKLKVTFEVHDESLAFANVQVVADVAPKEVRRFALEDAKCEAKTPFRCSAELTLPEQLPPAPGLTISAVDMGANRASLSQKDDRKLRVDWGEARKVSEQDYEPMAIGVRKVTQDKKQNTVTIEFVARGGDGVHGAAGSGKVIKNGPARETLVFALERGTPNCVRGDCTVTFTLPPKLPADNFQLELQVEGNNGRSDRAMIDRTLIDVSGIPVDTDPPRITRVEFETATAEELAAFLRER